MIMNAEVQDQRHSGRRGFGCIVRLVLGLLAVTGCESAAQATEPREPARAFLAAFRRHIELADQDVPHVARLADGVADRFVRNRELRIALTEKTFFFDLAGRAGGLTSIEMWTGTQEAIHDSVLLIPLDGTPDRPDDREGWLNTAARARDAQVVVMANRRDLAASRNLEAQRPFQPSDFYGFVDNHVPEGEFTYRVPDGDGTTTRRAMLSSLVNAMNGWLFVGELTAACTRRGEMPGIWLSYQVDMARGYARNLRYSISGRPRTSQHPFHDDFKIPPVPPGIVAKRYIAHLRSYLDRLERWPDLDEVVTRMVAAARRGGTIHFYSVGHIFPHEVIPRKRDHVLTLLDSHYFKLEENVLRVCRPGDLLFLLCMPEFEDKVVTSALEKGVEVVAMSSAPPPVPIQNHDDLYWIAAPWPMTDGCVEIPGYDVPILAVSGVMHATIYYAVRSQLDYELALAPRDATSVAN